MLQLRRQFEKSIMNSKFRSLKDKYHLLDNSTNVPTVDFNAFYNYLEKTICKYKRQQKTELWQHCIVTRFYVMTLMRHFIVTQNSVRLALIYRFFIEIIVT